MINTKRTPEGRSPGSLAWAGLANTYFWVDPARDVGGRDHDAGAAVHRRQGDGALRRARRGVYKSLDGTKAAA